MINFHILYLSIIQSLTEFLPVSSSGHLILFSRFFGFDDLGLTIDVAVHIGSIIAVVIYFSDTIWRVVKDMIKARFLPKFKLYGCRVFYLLLVATLPVVVVGFLLHDYGIEAFRSQKLIGYTLVGYGILLFVADKIGMTVRKIEHLSLMDAFIIGCGQCLALVPGTSRSGICITFCRFFGMERRESAKFAMLMSIPSILGAGLLVFLDVLETGSDAMWFDALDAVLYSFAGSILAIYIMMTWLKKSTFLPFIIYRIILGGYLLLNSYGVIL